MCYRIINTQVITLIWKYVFFFFSGKGCNKGKHDALSSKYRQFRARPCIPFVDTNLHVVVLIINICTDLRITIDIFLFSQSYQSYILLSRFVLLFNTDISLPELQATEKTQMLQIVAVLKRIPRNAVIIKSTIPYGEL